jgi:2',3'-cyclic-nucleotide 2'-phosphodiesterase/3'-nucleotidase
VLASQDGVREIVAAWLKRTGTLQRTALPANAWRFAPLKARGQVTFTAASGKQAIATADGVKGITQLRDHGDGTATYAIDLTP